MTAYDEAKARDFVCALVTGASSGIGRAICERLAAPGRHLVCLGRDEARLDEVAESVRARGAEASVLVADLLDRDLLDERIPALDAELGGIDVLVNNAGANVRKATSDYTHEDWDRLLGLLLGAPFHLARLLGPGMAARGYGRIVQIGSVAGARALPTGAPYAAAKAGLEGLTRALAREWGARGVTVNLIAPWYVQTAMTDHLLAQPAFEAAVLRETPAGRTGTPEEVAAAAAFLCTPEAAWINGVVLPMDGGFTASGFHP